MMNTAVEVRGLTVRRGRALVLDGLDLDIAAGRITGLLGPSGSGKTTLMRSIVGVQRIRGGRVAVLGRPAGSAALRTRVAYATQSAAAYRDLTVEQNLRYFGRLLGVDRAEVRRVLDAVDLGDVAGRRVDGLSGGQAGRVSLAIAMLGRPALLVLDEPTVGLDPILRIELWAAFRALADDGATLIVSSHVMDEALRCDDLLLMRDGRLIAATTPAALLAETGQPDPEAAFVELIRRDAAAHPGAAEAAA